MINTIGIIGLGALGMMYGDFFQRKLSSSNVAILLDQQRFDRYQTSQFTVNGESISYPLLSSANARPLDLIIVAVKAAGLQSAIETMRPFVGDQTTIISVMNGVSSEDELIRVFGEDKVLYVVSQGMDAKKIGNELAYVNFGELRIGLDSPLKQYRYQAFKNLLDTTAFPYTEEDDILLRLWSKLMLNTGVNQVVMINEGVYGDIQTPGPKRDLMVEAMTEVVHVANAKNMPLTMTHLEENLRTIDKLDPNSMPSMRQDGFMKRPSEVDLFSGFVVQLGQQLKVPTPINQAIYTQVKAMEATY